ncbi:MAG: dienelactone hydrolase family protein [Candidatus Hydrogenedentes bacterium]|nr:dienelactone hydrolase family protein [Candidatus Hydrogenedentota bacterium]
MKTEIIEYKDGDVVLEGFLAYDEALSSLRPGILIVHEWWGLGEHTKESAKKLAEAGYVAFAVDMYGKGKLTENMADAAKWSGEFKSNPPLAKGRFLAAHEVLASRINVDKSRIGAMGYCFGGTIVLEMARLGLDLDGVVSFHGGLGTTQGSGAKDIKAKVLVCHGADDPLVPAAEITAFQEEMRASKADWQFISYGGAVHSFTNPAATGVIPAAKYHEPTARRSWVAMMEFFGEVLK